MAFIPTQAPEAAISKSLRFTRCLKYNHSQPMWSYCPENAPSGNRQHQIEKNTCRFCSLLKYVTHLSQGIWEKQSRKLPEGSAQPHSSSRASPGLHVQYFPSFPRYWQVTPFQINCWKWQKTFFLPQPFGMSRQIPAGFFVQPSLVFYSTCSSHLLANKMLLLGFR